MITRAFAVFSWEHLLLWLLHFVFVLGKKPQLKPCPCCVASKTSDEELSDLADISSAFIHGDNFRFFENGKIELDSSKMPERGEDTQRRLPVVFVDWFSVVIHDILFNCWFSIVEGNYLWSKMVINQKNRCLIWHHALLFFGTEVNVLFPFVCHGNLTLQMPFFSCSKTRKGTISLIAWSVWSITHDLKEFHLFIYWVCMSLAWVKETYDKLLNYGLSSLLYDRTWLKWFPSL